MLGRYQRADEVKRGLVHLLEILGGVVPLVEDQRDVGNPAREILAPSHEFIRHTLESDAVVLISGVGVMEERDVAVRCDQQR